MANTKRNIIIYALITISILLIGHFYLSWESGKQNIQIQMQSALEKSIDIDFYNRRNKNIKYTGEPINTKVKQTTVYGENGIETITFKDSVEEYLVDKWSTQYALIQIHPIDPINFNDIFNKELNKKGIQCATGIIYQQKGKALQISGELTTYKNSIITPAVALDVKNTISVQAWANCDLPQTLKYANNKTGIYMVMLLIFLIITGSLWFYSKKQDNIKIEEGEETTPTNSIMEKKSPSVQKKIKIDEDEQKIYIDDKPFVTTVTGFKIMQLLINAPQHFVTKERIISEVWPEDLNIVEHAILNNRLNVQINNLRKTLQDFSEYQIKTEHGKGYYLIVPLSDHILS